MGLGSGRSSRSASRAVNASGEGDVFLVGESARAKEDGWDLLGCSGVVSRCWWGPCGGLRAAGAHTAPRNTLTQPRRSLAGPTRIALHGHFPETKRRGLARKHEQLLTPSGNSVGFLSARTQSKAYGAWDEAGVMEADHVRAGSRQMGPAVRA